VDFLSVNEVLSNLNLKRTDTVAEFGCGSASFALALAKILDKGRIYALDIQEGKLSVLKNKMALEKLHNIKTMVGDVEAPGGSGLKNNFLDAVVIPNILFQSKNRHGIMQEAGRVLKPEGEMLVVDWSKPVAFGPKENLASPDEVKKIGHQIGLSLKKEFAAGDYHYALLFVKI